MAQFNDMNIVALEGVVTISKFVNSQCLDSYISVLGYIKKSLPTNYVCFHYHHT